MPKSLAEVLTCSQEGPLLWRLLANPQDEAGRATYAAWLTARGDRRGEALGLFAALKQPGAQPDSASQRAWLKRLLADIDAAWWLEVAGDAALYGCGAAAADQSPVLRFRVRCNNPWETLTPTENADVRHCADCQHPVFRVASIAQAEAHARQGHCIAAPAALTHPLAKQLTADMVGRPDWVDLWAQRIFGRER